VQQLYEKDQEVKKRLLRLLGKAKQNAAGMFEGDLIEGDLGMRSSRINP
jgi:hypothetical protein